MAGKDEATVADRIIADLNKLIEARRADSVRLLKKNIEGHFKEITDKLKKDLASKVKEDLSSKADKGKAQKQED